MPWVFLVFFKFKEMDNEEADKARKRWNAFKKQFPAGIKLLGEYDHALGTGYNGFILLESRSSDDFLNWWKKFKDEVRWYITSTKTIIGRPQ